MLVHDVLALTAARTPEATALVFEDRSWTFAELDTRVGRLADGLARIAAPGDRVAMIAENAPEYVMAYYGVPRAGMALVFVNYRLSEREMVLVLEDAMPTVLIVEEKFLETARAAAAGIPSITTIVCVDGAPDGTIAFGELTGPAAAPPAPAGDEPAWLVYTSGTTTRAKGAVLTHRNVVASVLNTTASWEFDEGTGVLLMPWPLCHIAGYQVLVAHLRGDAVVLLRRYDPVGFLSAVAAHRVTITTVAPTMLAMLLRHPAFGEYDTSSITRIGYGSAPMPAAVLREAMAAFPGARFRTSFGMTELAGNVIVLQPRDHVLAAQSRPDLLTSVGRPMLLSAVRLVGENGLDVAPGEVGELVVRGDQVCAGYWRQPEATAAAFLGDWFSTGDLARRDAGGYISIVDRRKDMIVTGGENVYSREVEEVLHEHPDIAAAAVVGMPDALWGELVVAVIVPRDGRHPTTGDLREFCAGRLAGYKRPRRVLLVPELPRNAAGKVLKRELRALVSDVDPAVAALDRKAGYDVDEEELR